MSSAKLPIQAQGIDGEEEAKFTILFAAQYKWFSRFFSFNVLVVEIC